MIDDDDDVDDVDAGIFPADKLHLDSVPDDVGFGIDDRRSTGCGTLN